MSAQPVNPGLTPAISKKAQAQAAGCTIYRYNKDVESRCYSMLQYPDGEYSHIERKTDAEAWEDFDPAMVPEVAPPTDLEALWDAFRLGQVKDPRPDKLVFIEIVSRAISQATKAPPELKGAREPKPGEIDAYFAEEHAKAAGLDAVAEYLREMAKRETPSNAKWGELGMVSRAHWKIRAQEVIEIASRPSTPVSLVSPAPDIMGALQSAFVAGFLAGYGPPPYSMEVGVMAMQEWEQSEKDYTILKTQAPQPIPPEAGGT